MVNTCINSHFLTSIWFYFYLSSLINTHESGIMPINPFRIALFYNKERSLLSRLITSSVSEVSHVMVRWVSGAVPSAPTARHHSAPRTAILSTEWGKARCSILTSCWLNFKLTQRHCFCKNRLRKHSMYNVCCLLREKNWHRQTWQPQGVEWVKEKSWL